MSSSPNTNSLMAELSPILPPLAQLAINTIRLVQSIDPSTLERLQKSQPARTPRNADPCGTCSKAKVKVNTLASSSRCHEKRPLTTFNSAINCQTILTCVRDARAKGCQSAPPIRNGNHEATRCDERIICQHFSS